MGTNSFPDSRKSSSTDETWQTVVRRGRTGKPRSFNHDAKAASLQRAVRIRRSGSSLEFLIGSLSNTSWFESTKRQVTAALDSRPVSALFCLGLGAVGGGGAARHQLACAALLMRSFNIKDCSIADPVMDTADRATAEEAGFRIALNEADCSVSTDGVLLLFMPHCHLNLYERVLSLCHARKILPRVVLLGNSLKRDMRGACVTEWFHKLCASEEVRQEHCPDAGTSTLYRAFNDLAVVQFITHNEELSKFKKERRNPVHAEGMEIDFR